MIYKALLIVALLANFALAAETSKPAEATKPKQATPTVANYVYGHDSERQVFDFYQAKSDKPTPLLLMIHGGAWKKGDKSSYADSVQPYLDAGISVAAINYRYVQQGLEQKVDPPVKACLYDAARALQTLRSKAKEWNIDPTRVGSTGGSAGACTSLWLAMHDDLADPKSSDPIAHESSRLTCVAVEGAQTSLDPIQVRAWIPNAIYGGHAFGFVSKKGSPGEFEQLLENREKVLPLIKEYSPIELATKDDPAIYLWYPKQKLAPKAGQKEGDPTHSAMYGVGLAEKLNELGVEVVLSYPGHKDEKYGSPKAFLIEKLTKR